jgi:hypothetical protein
MFCAKVILIGPATVAATVFDHGNGSYEAIALIVDPGKYLLMAIVERSLCEGMKDPTPEFYTQCKYNKVLIRSVKYIPHYIIQLTHFIFIFLIYHY